MNDNDRWAALFAIVCLAIIVGTILGIVIARGGN